MMARTAPSLAALALSVLTSPAGSAAAPAELDFAALAAELRELCGGARGVEEALAQGFQHTQLGVFEVDFPKHSLADHRDLRRGAFQGLIDVQGAWLELFGDGDGAERGIDLVKQLSKWNRSAGAGPELPAELQAASAELAQLFADGTALGFPPVAARKARFVLAPDRRDFQRTVAFFGEADPNLRGLYWHDGVRVWTECWWNDLQIVALEYPPVQGDGDDPGAGIRMDFREPTGLEQHVCQRGAMALVWYTFGDGLTPTVELGLAQLLVIAAYGENNVRSGGSLRGNATAALEAFVPGGNPSGGFLPPVDADSSWRADKGKDHFVKALRASQKAASKDAPKGKGAGKHEKIAWFLLATGDGRHSVRAPFLGKLTAGKEQPPDAFASDYMEFFRAYKTAFLYWLSSAAAGNASRSRSTFRELAARIAADGGEGDFEALAAEVYGMPLTAADGDEDSLEWQFLTWLSKQR